MIKEIHPIKNKYYDQHEKVFYFEEKKVGLKGFIAWHNTKQGPATGGTRLFSYKNKSEALIDVLKLSRAMTYKCAISGVPFGGGKAVIMANQKQKNKPFLKAYANIINSFSGKYTTGTDVGISDEDTKFMSSITPFILKGTKGNTTTSLMAARGVYEGIIAAYKKVLPNKKLNEMRIAIKGMGKIGAELVRLLSIHKPKIFISDINKKAVSKIKNKFPNIEIIDWQKIHKTKVDVYSPCAMGGEFTEKTIKELDCKIIAGGANNQFKNEKDILKLKKKNIIYVPDYVINAGGLIQIVDELHKKGYNRNRVLKNVKNICFTTSKIIQMSKKTGQSTIEIAEKIAHEKIRKTK